MNSVLARAAGMISRLPGRRRCEGDEQAAAGWRWCGGCGGCRDCEVIVIGSVLPNYLSIVSSRYFSIDCIVIGVAVAAVEDDDDDDI